MTKQQMVRLNVRRKRAAAEAMANMRLAEECKHSDPTANRRLREAARLQYLAHRMLDWAT